MPKNLTDVIQFPTVSVPVGTDTATAASVESPLQDLADRTRYLLDALLSSRASNWFSADVSDITGGEFCSGANVMAICYEASQDRFWAIDDDGAICYTIPPNFSSVPSGAPGGGPHRWYDALSDPLDLTLWTASGSYVDICAGGNVVVCVSDSATGQVAKGGKGTAFAAQSPSTSGVSWKRCSYDPTSSLFFITGSYSTAAVVETSTDGVTWTARTVAAGFSVVAAIPSAIASDAGGVGGTMILTQTEYSHTLNGTSYTYGTHGLGSVPLALAYSDGRWVAILTNGDVAYSDDDGASWTAVTTPLDDFAATYVRIAADGLGGLVASCASATQSVMWASVDNGETWEPVYHQGMIDAMESGPAFGGGHFAAIGCLAGGTVAAMHSLRILEM